MKNEGTTKWIEQTLDNVFIKNDNRINSLSSVLIAAASKSHRLYLLYIYWMNQTNGLISLQATEDKN